MKKLFAAIVLIMTASFLLPLQANAQVELWQEGKHYKVISDTKTAEPEVTEYFSFWCPACYRAEPLVKQIKSQLPEGVAFNKIHVNFMNPRMASPQAQNDATKAMQIAQELKQSDAMNGAIFNYIHRQGSVITDLSDLRSIFVVNGVNGEQFDKMAKSFKLRSLVKRNNDKLGEFREHVSGVPNFIVNGKYQATFTQDMTVQQIIDLIIWLTKQD